MTLPFNVVVADPPWRCGDSLGPRGAEANYRTMPTVDICSMQLPPIADNAWLFMWRLSSMQQDALDVVNAWGFTVKSELVWYKTTANKRAWFGMGHYTRAAHETCLVCTRGSVHPYNRNVRDTFRARVPREEGKYLHSGKPNYFFGLVSSLVGPDTNRVELFGRRLRPGWTVLGNEVGKFSPARAA